MSKLRNYRFVLSLLAFLASLVFLFVLSIPDEKLHIIACDVGQGDAFIISHKSTQILVDGGPNNNVLSCLGEKLPFWDKNIEAVIVSNQDSDHYFGLIQVFKRYSVGSLLITPLKKEGRDFETLLEEIKKENSQVYTPSQGDTYRIGKLYIDIFWPIQTWESDINIFNSTISKNVNKNSLVFSLRFKNFSGFFTGDIDPDSIDNMMESIPLPVAEFIKVPHHGAKTGLTKELLSILDSKVGIISVGNLNRYGHPHKEVLDILNQKGVLVYRTDLKGLVELISDGEKWIIRE